MQYYWDIMPIDTILFQTKILIVVLCSGSFFLSRYVFDKLSLCFLFGSGNLKLICLYLQYFSYAYFSLLDGDFSHYLLLNVSSFLC